MLRLSWLISLGISLLGFLITGNLFSAKSDGNFGFIGVIFVIPFLLLSMFITFRYFLELSRKAKVLSKILSLVGGVLFIGILAYYFVDYKNNLNPTTNFPKINNQTYSIYINFYTFALLHTSAGWFGGLLGFISVEKEKEHTT
ncbi:hypothetical protein SAMN05880501_103151 [Ureibacillus xyleni]|uniref:Nucleoside-diphosphate sugar epimerase n=1 Tax=Ureibacillus xyleni TaxID=614648 RepID=A0A285S6G7_9BACL|nr:hypothetical protein [Ureibacillus xyleni]SOC03003.1 hypothetical protein SAMN05880501_103151 [Ureibacillus xyleni]